MLKLISFIIFLQFLVQSAFAQVSPAAELDKKTIQIGDQVNLTLTVKASSTTRLKWPVFADSIINGVEVVKKYPIDTIKDADNSFVYKQTLVITSFDAGSYTLPPFGFSIISSKGNQPVTTTSLSLSVTTIQIDSSKPIKDIKPPFDAPFTFIEILPYLLILLILIAVVILAIRYFKHKKTDTPLLPFIKEKQIPAHEIALSSLEELRQKKLWQQSKYKEYYTELTDILRAYLEKRYGILAQEMISDEIISALKNGLIDSVLQAQIANTLSTADLVKFAKDQPLPETNQRAFDNIFSFINQTAVHVKEEEKGGQDANI